MREERLLERIRTQEKDPGRLSAPDPARVMDSVLRHLGKILNTRQGSAPIAEDYGLPDFTSMIGTAGTQSVSDIERSITQAIQKYEPRLRNVKVAYAPREGEFVSLPFKLEARLALEGRQIPVVFETVLESDGRIRVRE